jgi:hypothetical protein
LFHTPSNVSSIHGQVSLCSAQRHAVIVGVHCDGGFG